MTAPQLRCNDNLKDEILDAIGRITLLIATSRAKVLDGHGVELCHIEATVKTLCDRVRSVELGDEVIVERLMRVQTELQALSDDLTEAFETRFGGDRDASSQAFA